MRKSAPNQFVSANRSQCLQLRPYFFGGPSSARDRDPAIGRSSTHCRSGSGSSTGRTRRHSSALDKSPGRHTNRPARDFAPAPLRSVRVNGSRAGNHIRASDVPRGALPARAQRTWLWLRTAKLQSRSDKRNFATLRVVLLHCFYHRVACGGLANRPRKSTDDERLSRKLRINRVLGLTVYF
jgi:hypothetical protein